MITVICTTGVVLGVAAFVTVMSVAGGFQEEFRNKVLGQNGHLLVMKYGIDFHEYRDVVARSGKVDDVLGATPFIFHEMMVSAGAKLSGVLVKGVDPKTVGDAVSLPDYMTAGKVTDLVGGEGVSQPTILLGEELARSLGVGLGDPVTLVSPLRGLDPRSWGPRDTRPSSRTFQVAGTFRSGFHEYDARLVYTHLGAIQDFFGQGDTVTGVEIRVSDIHSTRRIARELRKALGDQRYAVSDWRALHPGLEEGLRGGVRGWLRGVLPKGWIADDAAEEALRGVSHVTLVRDDGPFLEWRNAVQEAEFITDVRSAGPMIQGGGELRRADRPDPIAVRIRGHSLDAGVTDYRDWLVEGDVKSLTRLAGPPGDRAPAGLLLEAKFAKAHGFAVGDAVTLTAKSVDKAGENMPEPIAVAFQVAGLVDPPHAGGEATVWLDFVAARRMLSTLDAAGAVEVRLKAPLASTEYVASLLRQRLGGHAYRTLDWREINQNLFKSLALQKFILTLIVFAMVVVAMFNIVSTLFIIVVDKSREIAILKSMGATSGGVLRTFILEGGAIGLVGTLAGLALGVVACAVIGAVDYELDASIYLIDALPVRPVPSEFAAAAGVAFLTSLLATIYPAAKAAALPPVEGLRRN